MVELKKLLVGDNGRYLGYQYNKTEEVQAKVTYIFESSYELYVWILVH